MDDEGGELGERRVEQARLGTIDVGVDRGAVMGVAGVDDVPRLGAFEDQLGRVADEVEQRQRWGERARPPSCRELGRAQLAQRY